MIEKEQAFRRDFQALLDKYGAEFHVQDHYDGYAECGQDIRVTISFDDPFQSFVLDNFYTPTVKP